jgi:hypothetical protein
VDVKVTALGETMTAPANLDWPGPWWPIGTLTTQGEPGELTVAPVDSAVDLAPRKARVLAIAAVPADEKPRNVPLNKACGLHVDWYRLGS